MAELPFRRIAILGAGLIGGSFGLAVKKHLRAAVRIGWDTEGVIEESIGRGAVDEGTTSLPDALRDADLVYLALPLQAAISTLPMVAQHAPPCALVTDACSTKVILCEAAARHFASNARFVGGHPMTGGEKSGVANARANLFEGAQYALIGTSQDKDARVQEFAKLVRTMGAEPVWMDAATHDWAAAIVSHLPQLAAVALARVAFDETDETGLPLTLAGPGLRDSLRLAGSPYDLWRTICHSNPENIRRALDRLIVAIEHLRDNLKTRELENEFAVANEVYKSLQGMK